MTAEEQLAYERQQAEVLAIRQRRDAGPKRDEPSRLATVLNSTVLVALVGVLGTGIFGAWISGLIQQRAKDNELERVSHEQRVSSQNTAVLRVLTLVANQASAIDDLLTIVHSSYNESAFSGQELADLVAWKKTIRSNHDQADSTWRRRNEAPASRACRLGRRVTMPATSRAREGAPARDRRRDGNEPTSSP
jgi:hypothetical protein